MADYLSFYARAVALAPDPAPVRRGRDADDAADHRPDRHPAPPAQGVAARLLEHGPAPRRQPGPGEDVAAQPGRRGAEAAQRLRLSAGRRGGGPRPLHGRPDRRQGGPAPTAWSRSRSGAAATRSIPCPAQGHPLRACSASRTGSSRCTRATSAWPTAFDEFLEAARRLRDRPDIVFLFVGGGPRLAEVRGAREREGSTTSGCSTTSPASSCTPRSRWPTST